MTTKDIIKILPVGADFQHRFISQYDKFNQDQKYEIEALLWDAYDAYFDMKLQQNIELAMLEIQVNGGSLDSAFYQRIEEQTKKQLVDEFHQETTDVGLTAVREKLESYMGGIQNGQSSN